MRASEGIDELEGRALRAIREGLERVAEALYPHFEERAVVVSSKPCFLCCECLKVLSSVDEVYEHLAETGHQPYETSWDRGRGK